MSEKIVQLNEEVIRGQIKGSVRGSAEETLIEMYLAGVSVRRVDGIYLRHSWVAILVAISANEDGYREVFGTAEGMKEGKASWVTFFQRLRSRSLDGVKLVVGDKGGC